jgi:hypothetical protein
LLPSISPRAVITTSAMRSAPGSLKLEGGVGRPRVMPVKPGMRSARVTQQPEAENGHGMLNPTGDASDSSSTNLPRAEAGG